MDFGRFIMGEISKGGVDGAVVAVTRATSTYAKIFSSRIDSVVRDTWDSASVFMAKDKRLMFTNVEDLGEKKISGAVAAAIRGLAIIGPKDYYHGIANGPFRYGARPDNDTRITKGDYDIGDIADGTVNSALAAGASEVHGMLTFLAWNTQVITTGGVDAEQQGTTFKCSVRAFTKEDTSAQQVGVSRKISGVDFGGVGGTAGEIANASRYKGKIDSGTYDIIYHPLAAGNFLAVLGGAASVSSVESGFSCLAGKLGKKVGNRQITLRDDATIRDGINSYVFDEEGVPAQNTTVIDRGVLKTYLHNTSTAKKYGTKSTGNAGLLGPDSSNIVFEHSKRIKDVDAAIRETRKGILVTNTWYTRFSNYLKGAFSTVPRDTALYIKDGEVKFCISMGVPGSASTGIRINDSFPRMLSETAAGIGKAVQAKGWDASNVVFTPSILVKDVKVTTASFI